VAGRARSRQPIHIQSNGGGAFRTNQKLRFGPYSKRPGASPASFFVQMGTARNGAYCSDRGIGYTLLRRLWALARRERRSIPAAVCDGVSNEARAQRRRNPQGQGVFWPTASSLARGGSLGSTASLTPRGWPKSRLAKCILSHGLSSR
jgi:hypothetical protein